LISATGIGPSANKGEIYPPAVSIAAGTDAPIFPVHFGHAEAVAVGFSDEGSTSPNTPTTLTQRQPGETERFDTNHGNIYFVTNSGKLCALFDYGSKSARVLREKRAAETTPSPSEVFEGEGMLRTSDGEEEEKGEEGGEDAVEEEESLDDEAHDELFAGLSSALASNSTERDFASHAAKNDPTLSKDGPVNVKVIVRVRPLLPGELARKIPGCVKTTRKDVTLEGNFLPQKMSKTYVDSSRLSDRDLFSAHNSEGSELIIIAGWGDDRRELIASL